MSSRDLWFPIDRFDQGPAAWQPHFESGERICEGFGSEVMCVVTQADATYMREGLRLYILHNNTRVTDAGDVRNKGRGWILDHTGLRAEYRDLIGERSILTR